jgi:hypothetical protein
MVNVGHSYGGLVAQGYALNTSACQTPGPCEYFSQLPMWQENDDNSNGKSEPTTLKSGIF